MQKYLSLIFFLIFAPNFAFSKPAVVSSIKPSDLVEYDKQSSEVKKLISSALDLTTQDLAYTFGSASPSKGGMDCSGTINHLLKSQGLKDVPRMSHTIYLWVEKNTEMTKLEHVYTTSHPKLRSLKPGDLVFWEGTYSVAERNPPISHVMLYLGTLKKDGKGVLFGASSGRRFRGKKIHGVSVFDFKVPSKTSKAKMVGFGPVPGIRSGDENSSTESNRGDNGQKPILGRKILEVFSNKKTP